MVGPESVLSQIEGNLKKEKNFVDTMISNILHDLRFSLNEPLQSADKWYFGILQNVIKTYEYVDFLFFTYFEFSLPLH